MANHSQNFLRFCIVGAINTAIDFGVFWVFFYIFAAPLLAAHMLGFFTATANSYVMNKYWTFSDHSRPDMQQAIKFLAVTSGGLVLSSIFIYFASLYVPAWAAKLMTMAITVGWNYTGSTLFVFRKKETR